MHANTPQGPDRPSSPRSGPNARPRRAAARTAATLAEFAIIFPIFLLFIFGLLEVGRGMMTRELMVNAAREGARKAILHGAVAADIVAKVEEHLDRASLSAPTRTVELLDDAGNTVSDLSSLISQDRITVRITIPADEVAWSFGRFIGGDFVAAVPMLKE